MQAFSPINVSVAQKRTSHPASGSLQTTDSHPDSGHINSDVLFYNIFVSCSTLFRSSVYMTLKSVYMILNGHAMPVHERITTTTKTLTIPVKAFCREAT